MKNLVLALALSLISLNTVLASGYGGYDEEPYEATTIEINVKGQLKASCADSEKTISDSVSISNCYDKWVSDENCNCLEDGGYKLCEATKTFSCSPEVNYNY